MGREIRRVPPDWQHPREHPSNDYIPLYDSSYDEAAQIWITQFLAWEQPNNQDRLQTETECGEHVYFWDWAGPPPNPNSYRPHWTPQQCSSYQIYETISEGTPISPVLHTTQELKNWLTNDGHGMGLGGTTYRMTPQQADNFINAGALTLTVSNTNQLVFITSTKEKLSP
jgi:hypothetical protein